MQIIELAVGALLGDLLDEVDNNINGDQNINGNQVNGSQVEENSQALVARGNRTMPNDRNEQEKRNESDSLLEEKKISFYRLDSYNYDLQTIDVIPYKRLQSYTESLLNEKKTDNVNNRSEAYEDLKKEIVSPEFKERLREAIKASEREIKKNNPGSDAAGQRNSLYKANKSKLTHQAYDPIIFNFERIYHESRPYIDHVINDLEIYLTKNKAGYLIKTDDYVLIMYKSYESDRVIPNARIDFNHNRFEKVPSIEGGDGYSDIYRHKANGRQYVKDANGVFVPRYVVRYLSDYDDPMDQGLKSRTGKRPEGVNVNNSILSHLRAAQQETSYYISCTTTQKPILGSTGADFYNPTNGQVIIDLSKIKQTNIYDVHSIPAIMNVITDKDLRWDIEYNPNLDQQPIEYEKNAAARDTIRTRELLIHEEVPKVAIVQMRKQSIQGGNWIDFQKEYNENPTSEAHKHFIDSEFSRWTNKLLRDSPAFKSLYYEGGPFSQEFINKLTLTQPSGTEMKQAFVERIQNEYRRNNDKVPIDFLNNEQRVKSLVADYELVQMSDMIQQHNESEKLSLIDAVANRRLKLAKHYLDVELLGTMWQAVNRVIDDEKASHVVKKLIDRYTELGEQYLGNPITTDNIIDYGKSLDLDSLGENDNIRAKRHEPTRQAIETFNQALEKIIYIADVPHSIVFDNKNSQKNIQNDVSHGLSWLLGSAFEKDGWVGLDRLTKNLDHILQQKSYDAEVFRTALSDLHTHANEAHPLDLQKQQYTLKDICQKLGTDAATTMYKLGTPNHAIVIVVRVDTSGRRSYLFADPASNASFPGYTIDPTSNVVVFRRIKELESHLNRYFTPDKLIDPQVIDATTTPKFGLTPIQVDPVKNTLLQVENGVFVDTRALWETPANRIDNLLDYLRSHAQENRLVMDTLRSHGIVESDYSIGKLMQYLDFSGLVSLHRDVLQKIKQANSGLDNSYVPVYSLMEQKINGDLRIPFLDSNNPKKTTWIDISSSKQDLLKDIKKIHIHHEKVSRRRFQSKYSWAVVANQLDDLYGYFGIVNQFRALIFDKTHTQQQVLSVYLNGIINKAQLSVGTGQIISVALPKAHQYLSKIKPAATGLSSLGKVGNVASKIGKGLPIIGLGLETVSIGVNIYDLTQAQTSLQKASAATQIGLGVTGAGITTGMLVASALGAGAVAGALTGVGLLLIPVGLLVDSVFTYCDNVQSAEEVYKYLGTLARAYKKAYEYKDGALTFVYGAVVTKIDLKSKQICFGSQRMPGIEVDTKGWYRERTFSIDVLKGMNMSYQKDFKETISTLILPTTADQKLEYRYAEGALYPNTKVDTDGNLLIESLRNHGVRTEWTETRDTSGDATRSVRMSMNGIQVKDYLPTRVEVILDKQVKQIYVPKVDSSVHNKFTYALQGDGGQYACTLTDKIQLELSESNGSRSTWIINSEKLDSADNIIVETDKLIIGGVPIKLSGLTSSPLIIQRKNGDVCTIDLQKKETKLIQMSGKEWLKRKDASRPFDGYTTDSYVLIKDYTNNSRNVGNAYYEVSKKQVLFSSTAAESHTDELALLDNAHLDIVVGNEAYWHNPQEELIWRTDAQTGEIKVQYLPRALNPEKWHLKNMHFECLEGQLYVKQCFYSRIGPVKAKWRTYSIHENKMELVANYTDVSSHPYIVSPAQNFSKLFLNVREISPSVSSLVKYYDTTDSEGCYWLQDGKDRIEANVPSEVDASARKSLVYLGGVKSADQRTETFYFYDSKNKKLYQQQGPGTTDALDRPKAKSISNKRIENAYLFDGSIRVTTEDGLTYLMGSEGQLGTSSVQAVEETWLKAQGNSWIQKLNTLLQYSKQSVLIRGLRSKETEGHVFASYDAGKLTVLDLGTSLVFLGLNHTGEQAYLFDSKTGKLYQQKIPSQAELPSMFSGYQIGSTFSEREALLPGLAFKSVIRMDNGIFHLVTKNQSNDDEAGIELLWDSKNNQITLLKVTQDFIKKGLNSNQAQEEAGAAVLARRLIAFWDDPLGQLLSSDEGDSISQTKKIQKIPFLLEALLNAHPEWKTSDVILISGDETTLSTWYHIGLKKIVGNEGVTMGDEPEYLGTVTKANQIRVYIGMKNGHRVETYNNKKNKSREFEFSNSSFSTVHLKRLDDKNLLIKGQSSDGSFTPFLMDKVDCVVLQSSGSSSKEIYQLASVFNDNIKSVIINHYKIGSDAAQDELIYTINNKTKFGRHEEHLCITDDRGTILIRNIFGKHKEEYNRLKINLSDKSYMKDVSEMVASLEHAQQLTRSQVFYNLAEFVDKGYLVYEQNGELKNIIGVN